MESTCIYDGIDTTLCSYTGTVPFLFSFFILFIISLSIIFSLTYIIRKLV